MAHTRNGTVSRWLAQEAKNVLFVWLQKTRIFDRCFCLQF